MVRRLATPMSDPRLRVEAIDARRSLLARALRGRTGRAFARADLAGMRAIRSTARSRRATRAIVVFSRAGEHGALWLGIGAIGAAVDRGRREQWAIGLTGVAAAYLTNNAVKRVARRPRPQLIDLPPLVPTPTQLSFPSSHAASSFAAATVYAGLLPRGPLFVTAGAMALSRVHLGVHYPTDIVIGATLGCTVGRAVRLVGDGVRARRAPSACGSPGCCTGGDGAPSNDFSDATGPGSSPDPGSDPTTTEGPSR